MLKQHTPVFQILSTSVAYYVLSTSIAYYLAAFSCPKQCYKETRQSPAKAAHQVIAPSSILQDLDIRTMNCMAMLLCIVNSHNHFDSI